MQKINLLVSRLATVFLWASLCSWSTSALPSDTQLTCLKVRFQTALLAETIEFYTEVLELTVLDQWDENGDRGVILGLNPEINGTAFLEFGYRPQPAKSENATIQFRVNSLAETVERLRGMIEFAEPEMRPWGSTYLYLEDPNGIQVVVYEGRL